MNLQLQDEKKVPYYYAVTDADGNADVPSPGDSVSLSSSDTASLTILPDAVVDPTKAPAGVTSLQTGFLIGESKLQVGVSVTSTLVLANGTVVPPQVTLIDIVAGVEAGGGLNLGVPVSQ